MWKKYSLYLLIEIIVIFLIAYLALGYNTGESFRFVIIVLLINFILRGIRKGINYYITQPNQ